MNIMVVNTTFVLSQERSNSAAINGKLQSCGENEPSSGITGVNHTILVVLRTKVPLIRLVFSEIFG